ncbi:MAG: S1 RNA-binding domain-containing protein [Bacillota bacterium]|uniref:S1 RNA-binding domain-containing protein n=1 Tax=Thermanaerosceptrum fracticalcis TaxID=1712410 RepID=A0A7G6E5M9_THEFR|nr:S1 RNA-binding domain-containing protein [Thermanaerosceptrum fracticalcis]MBZ4655379.1 putative RNA-binding protein with ribosomal protein domain [Peptococcaceae bacterium]QNB47383.1 S1 RNA-binding domain-containing protein [Thermanaerosceptrum fracticalcis]
MSIAVGAIIEGVVTGITSFGAFVELPGGVTGLVHISEVADAYVKDVKDYLKEQDKIKVKVINIDPKGKIGLSIKQANPNPNSPGKDRRREKPRANQISFEDKLAKFMKDSDERLQEYKRSTDAKRGGRGSSRY